MWKPISLKCRAAIHRLTNQFQIHIISHDLCFTQTFYV